MICPGTVVIHRRVIIRIPIIVPIRVGVKRHKGVAGTPVPSIGVPIGIPPGAKTNIHTPPVPIPGIIPVEIVIVRFAEIVVVDNRSGSVGAVFGIQ